MSADWRALQVTFATEGELDLALQWIGLDPSEDLGSTSAPHSINA